MNRSSRKVALFETAREYASFLIVLREALELHSVDLLAFCVMPNHWHLVVHAGSVNELSSFMKWVANTHAIRWHKRRGTWGYGPVYKGRFISVPVNAEADLVRVCRYVERNPLRAGLVARAERWPWSSLSERFRIRPRVRLVSAPFLTSPAWIDYVNTPHAASELVAMHRLAGAGDDLEMVENLRRSVPERAFSVEN